MPASAALFWVWHSHRPCFGPGSGGTGPLDLSGHLPRRVEKEVTAEHVVAEGRGEKCQTLPALPLASPGSSPQAGPQRRAMWKHVEPLARKPRSGFQCMRCYFCGSNLIHCDVSLFLTEQDRAGSGQRKAGLGLKPRPHALASPSPGPPADSQANEGLPLRSPSTSVQWRSDVPNRGLALQKL